MNYSIVNAPAVRNDLLEATFYYKKINSDLAKQFLFRIREAKSFIALAPLGFQTKYKQVRTLMLKQFPYHIHYLIDDSRKQIIILAVVHAYKNPKDYTESISS